MKKISVIMGVFNCEKTIREAIDSIVNQTYENWELIICDDASTDNTKMILEEYKKKYESKIIVLYNPTNMRLSHSLNRCLELASGDYIARMDADDISLPLRFKTQVDFLDNHPQYDLVSSRCYLFDGEKIIGVVGKEGEPDKHSLIKGTPFYHPTIMVRKEVYQLLNGYTVSKRTARAQDLDLWFRFFYNNFRGYIVDDVLYRYTESIADYKRRSFKKATCSFRTRLWGYRLLKFSIFAYPFALKPLISSLVPSKIMRKYKLNKIKKQSTR